MEVIKSFFLSAIDNDAQSSVILQSDTVTAPPNSLPQASQDVASQAQEIVEALTVSEKKSIDGAQYTLLTFGSLTFMIVSLYLPQLITLKIPGIELEKSSIDQIKATSSLGITR